MDKKMKVSFIASIAALAMGGCCVDKCCGNKAESCCADKECGYVSLFDGKTLNGWKVRGGEAKFSVVDGEIRGEGVPSNIGLNTFLTTEKDYGDFDFIVEFLCESGNSGVQFRSTDRKCKWDPLREVIGYQAEITPNGWATGRIYDECVRGYQHGIIWLDVSTPECRAKLAQSSFKKNNWNEMRVRCEGPSIKTWLNGHLVADLLDDARASGFIGLQIHVQGPAKPGVKFVPGVARFRNPRIKELPRPKSAKIVNSAMNAKIAAKVLGEGGTNDFSVVTFGDRTVLRLNGFEVYDSNNN